MYQFLALYSLSTDQTLGQRLPGLAEPPGKMMCCGIKIYSANVVFETLGPMRSLSTEANHSGFNKLFSYLLI